MGKRVGKKFLYWVVTGVTIGFGTYGFFIEPNHVRLKTVKVRHKVMASIFKDLKIVQLSDLHIGDNISTSIEQTLEIL